MLALNCASADSSVQSYNPWTGITRHSDIQSGSSDVLTYSPSQPLEVVKTTMAANRSDSFGKALARVWGRGGVAGC